MFTICVFTALVVLQSLMGDASEAVLYESIVSAENGFNMKGFFFCFGMATGF